MARTASLTAGLFVGLSAASGGTIKTRAGWIVIDTRESFQVLGLTLVP